MSIHRSVAWISAIVAMAGLVMGCLLLNGEGRAPSPLPPTSATAAHGADMRLSSSNKPEQPASVPTTGSFTPVPPGTGTATDLVQELRAGAARVLVQEKLSPHQIGVKALSCQGRSCHIALQLPPFVEASVKRDSTVAAELMDALRAEYGKQGAQVALTQLEHAREGMSISFQVEAATEKGRYLTDAQIAQLRAETIEAYLKSQKR